MKALSIIIPVYNTEKYIKQCLNSVLGQTLSDLEIIIIDDASTDNSLEIINQYKKTDPRIKVLPLQHNSPGGVGTPANQGIEMAKGEYIGFVDSDDWIKPEMFETLYGKAKETDADFVFCDFFRFDDEKKLIMRSNDRDHWNNFTILHQPCKQEEKSALLKLSAVPWRKIYKRSFLKKNNLRFPEGDFFYEDTPFHYMVTLKAEKISYIDVPLYYHRISRSNK